MNDPSDNQNVDNSLREVQSLRKRVAELEHANAILEAREGRYRELIEHARDMIWTVDLAGSVTFLNAACQAITGYTRDELIGKSLDEIIPPENLRSARDALSRSWDGDRSRHYEIRILAKDGGAVDLEVSAALLERAGAPAGILAIARDITGRKQVQESLRQTALNFEYLFANHPLPMWVVDNKTLQFLEVNQAAVEKYGYSREEFLTMTSIDVRPASESERLREYFRELQPGGHGDAGHWRHLTKDGRVLDAEVFWRSTKFAGRDAVLAMIEDITERKRLEEELRQAQKLEAVGRLAGGVAHDFNNLLTVIVGYSQLLLNRIDREHPMHAGLDQIRHSAEKAGLLTRQLLAFSRRQSMQPGILYLNNIVAAMEKTIRRLSGNRIELVMRLSPDLARVRADPNHIEQTITNLVMNAREAMPQGGTITLETAPVEFSSREAAAGHSPGAYAMVAVTDTGTGIDSETRSHLFEPFFTTKGDAGGGGLGLSVAHGMIEQHGGFIRALSELGEGARFEVYLPAIPDLDGISASEATGRRGSETILVVEDQAGVLKLVAETLRVSGYKVIESVDSAAALEMANREQPRIDLLLTDVVMPCVNGRDLADAWKRLHPGLKVLFISGDPPGEMLSGMREQLLQKPFSAIKLRQAVREALDGQPD